MFAKMTTREQYRFFLQQLQTIYNLNEATIITDWVFENLAHVKRFDVIKTPAHPLTDAITNQLNTALTALLQHKPVQYVTGEAWFYNMKLKVNEHVLIPRPETEELVQLVLNTALAQARSTPAVLDVGTGSGCIAIAVKKNLPGANVTAIDISSEALQVAKENATALQADIKFLKVDFLKEEQWAGLGQLDFIVSNPPYIPVNEKENMDVNVTAFEPHLALFVPSFSPLLFYENILAFAGTHLNPGGKIFVETHEGFANETAALFKEQYKNVEIKKDIFGKERMVIATH